MNKRLSPKPTALPAALGYPDLVGGIGALLELSRRASARAVNALMTATYWEVGRRIVEFEQGGAKRAGYGQELLDDLAEDLCGRFGRGFSRRNLQSMRQLYLFLPAQLDSADTVCQIRRNRRSGGALAFRRDCGKNADTVCQFVT